jgi:DNA polymerase/3'-5' exonuclease PolX
MNAELVKVLEDLKQLRITQKQTGRAHGYTRAIQALKAWPKKITSYAEAIEVPGIGDSIASKLDEFIRTDKVTELSPNDERDKVIKLFMEIDQVGPVTARQWYDAGHRALADLQNVRLSAGQRASLQYHDELIQRIPRAEIDEFNAVLAGAPVKYEICGSYRRKHPTSGDVDVLVVAEPGKNAIAEIKAWLSEERLGWKFFTHVLSEGPKKLLGICQLVADGTHRRIDLELVQPEELPCAVTYFTGSKDFNIWMRDHASTLGYRLNEKQLLLADTQIPAPVATEQQLFEILGIAWVEPEQRDIKLTPKP